MKKIIIVNTFIFFILFFFLEFSTRFLNIANVLGHDKNLYALNAVPRSHNPNVQSKAFGKTVFTDSYGFRVPKQNYKYNDSKKSILILGDSVTFGLGVEEEKSIIGILRAENNKFNFYNTSVSGHNLKSYKDTLSKYIDTLKFQKVIIFICLNDIYFHEGVQKKKIENDKKSFVQILKQNNIAVNINNFLRGKSALYVLIKSLMTNPRERYFNAAYPMYFNKNSLDMYEKYIFEMKNLSNKNKELVFILLPFEPQTRKDKCNEKNLKPQKIIKTILTKNNLKFFDFSNNFCEHPTPEDLYLKYDSAHLSVKGHSFLKTLIYNKKSILQLN